MKNVISTNNAPKAIGPYSQAIVTNGLVFLSGQIPLDPATGQPVGVDNDGDIGAQTACVLDNVKNLLAAAGSSMEKVVKTTVFLKDMGEFSLMNEVYARYFTVDPPARSTVEVSRLPRDVRIEIECIATV